MMVIKTLGIEDWYEIAQDRQQWMTVCEQICASADLLAWSLSASEWGLRSKTWDPSDLDPNLIANQI